MNGSGGEGLAGGGCALSSWHFQPPLAECKLLSRIPTFYNLHLCVATMCVRLTGLLGEYIAFCSSNKVATPKVMGKEYTAYLQIFDH